MNTHVGLEMIGPGVLLLVLQFSLTPRLVIGQPNGGYTAPPAATCSCTYSASWSLDVATDVITFVITAQQPQTTWTAIGISQGQLMQNQSVYYGFINSTGGAVIASAWASEHWSTPVLNAIQVLTNPSLTYINGVFTLTFSRRRNPGLGTPDWIFTDSNCYYFKFPVGGGPHDDQTLYQHTLTPLISASPICITSGSTSLTPTTSSSTSGTSTSGTENQRASVTTILASGTTFLWMLYTLDKH